MKDHIKEMFDKGVYLVEGKARIGHIVNFRFDGKVYKAACYYYFSNDGSNYKSAFKTVE